MIHNGEKRSYIEYSQLLSTRYYKFRVFLQQYMIRLCEMVRLCVNVGLSEENVNFIFSKMFNFKSYCEVLCASVLVKCFMRVF
jgi:hypothetical protein